MRKPKKRLKTIYVLTTVERRVIIKNVVAGETKNSAKIADFSKKTASDLQKSLKNNQNSLEVPITK